MTTPLPRHARESGHPERLLEAHRLYWIPAFAGMTREGDDMGRKERSGNSPASSCSRMRASRKAFGNPQAVLDSCLRRNDDTPPRHARECGHPGRLSENHRLYWIPAFAGRTPPLPRHARESGHPERLSESHRLYWIPAFAGMMGEGDNRTGFAPASSATAIECFFGLSRCFPRRGQSERFCEDFTLVAL
jgi:hypothetical protein